jgi:hypothetical protein
MSFPELALGGVPDQLVINKARIADHNVAPSVGSSEVVGFVISAKCDGQDVVKRRVSVILYAGVRISRQKTNLAHVFIAFENNFSVLLVGSSSALTCRRRN